MSRIPCPIKVQNLPLDSGSRGHCSNGSGFSGSIGLTVRSLEVPRQAEAQGDGSAQLVRIIGSSDAKSSQSL